MTWERNATFDTVSENVLAIRGTVIQATEQGVKLGVDTVKVGFKHDFFASFEEFFVHFFLGFNDDFLNAGGVDTSVLDEFFQANAGDFATNRVESGNHNHAGGIVDNNINAGSFFEGANVTPFTTNDPALHVVVWYIYGGNRAIAGMLSGKTLDGIQGDFAALGGCFFLGFGDDSFDKVGGFVANLVFDTQQKQFLGFLN